MNRAEVSGIDGFKQAYGKSKNGVLLRVLRDGRMLYLAVKR